MTVVLEKQWINLDVDGSSMETYMVKPEGAGPWPAVIVLMEVFGINSHIREVTERLAIEGYVGMAINYYHRTTKNMELGYSAEEVAIGRTHKAQTTREGVFSDMHAALDYLKAQPYVYKNQHAGEDAFGTIGFCFGGHIAYLVSNLPEINATVSFYGAGIATSTPGNEGEPTLSMTPEIKGEILCLFGEQDSLIPHSQTVKIVKALEEANIPHEVVRYPEASHGFFCNHRSDFNPYAAKDAWERVMKLFGKCLSKTSERV